MIHRLKPPITRGSIERFVRGVYVISAIMSNICAILLARCRPYCSRDNGYAFFLPLTHPPSSRVATGNPVVFTLQPPECYMEIRYGYGTTGTRVAGPVRVGDPLTLIIYMRSKYGKPRTQLNCSFATSIARTHNGFDLLGSQRSK